MTIITIKAVARIQDNGDGSTTATIYNDKEAMLKDFRKYTAEDKVSDAQFFGEDDPYENGYLNMSVTLEIDTETGKLVRPFSVSGG